MLDAVDSCLTKRLVDSADISVHKLSIQHMISWVKSAQRICRISQC